jgi:hypothetical protein
VTIRSSALPQCAQQSLCLLQNALPPYSNTFELQIVVWPKERAQEASHWSYPLQLVSLRNIFPHKHHSVISTTCTKPANAHYSSAYELWFLFFMRLMERKMYIFPSQRKLDCNIAIFLFRRESLCWYHFSGTVSLTLSPILSRHLNMTDYLQFSLAEIYHGKISQTQHSETIFCLHLSKFFLCLN